MVEALLGMIVREQLGQKPAVVTPPVEATSEEKVVHTNGSSIPTPPATLPE